MPAPLRPEHVSSKQMLEDYVQELRGERSIRAMAATATSGDGSSSILRPPGRDSKYSASWQGPYNVPRSNHKNTTVCNVPRYTLQL